MKDETNGFNDSPDVVDFYLSAIQSNEMFSLFLDETMTYSCAIFKVRMGAFYSKVATVSFKL